MKKREHDIQFNLFSLYLSLTFFFPLKFYVYTFFFSQELISFLCAIYFEAVQYICWHDLFEIDKQKLLIQKSISKQIFDPKVSKL